MKVRNEPKNLIPAEIPKPIRGSAFRALFHVVYSDILSFYQYTSCLFSRLAIACTICKFGLSPGGKHEFE